MAVEESEKIAKRADSKEVDEEEEEDDDEIRTFEEMGLDPRLICKDVVARAKTGSSKTYAYLLPMLQKLFSEASQATKAAPRAVVLVPTRELTQQVYLEISSLLEVCRTQLKVVQLSAAMSDADLHLLVQLIFWYQRQPAFPNVCQKAFFNHHLFRDHFPYLLKHDKVLSKKPPPSHLKAVPDYLRDPVTEEAKKIVKLSRAAMPKAGSSRRHHGSKGKFRRSKDPLKTFSAENHKRGRRPDGKRREDRTEASENRSWKKAKSSS
ncbi:DEAD-box ATP-dependent RNA helicase 16 [Nymphaea thermarum]|nr:DEAD-box ATP-dependent RNA helicase 16 [Nymphaea thermarum]